MSISETVSKRTATGGLLAALDVQRPCYRGFDLTRTAHPLWSGQHRLSLDHRRANVIGRSRRGNSHGQQEPSRYGFAPGAFLAGRVLRLHHIPVNRHTGRIDSPRQPADAVPSHGHHIRYAVRARRAGVRGYGHCLHHPNLRLLGAWPWRPSGRPLVLLASSLFMLWWSFAISLLVCAGCHASVIFERLLHPVTYLLMPLSGAFFVLRWLPEPYRTWLSWFPMTQIY